MIFSDADYLTWLRRFLKPGFSHVRIIIHKTDYDIAVDPRLSYTGVEAVRLGYDLDSLGVHRVTVTRRIPVGKMRGVIGLLSCVEQAKILLGVSNRWVLTPYQLFKELSHD